VGYREATALLQPAQTLSSRPKRSAVERSPYWLSSAVAQLRHHSQPTCYLATPTTPCRNDATAGTAELFGKSLTA